MGKAAFRKPYNFPVWHSEGEAARGVIPGGEKEGEEERVSHIGVTAVVAEGYVQPPRSALPVTNDATQGLSYRNSCLCLTHTHTLTPGARRVRHTHTHTDTLTPGACRIGLKNQCTATDTFKLEKTHFQAFMNPAEIFS